MLEHLSVRNYRPGDIKGSITLINEYKCTLINKHKVRFTYSTTVLYSFVFKMTNFLVS